ncbi:MAG: peroxiredoxin [Hyphomicrobiales bacterium]
MKKIKVGSKIPQFELIDQHGKKFDSHSLIGEKNIVLYFYPKDFTPGCTIEAKGFRDSYEVFKEAGAEVIGISADSIESHENFCQKNQLPYILLSDPGNKVRNSFGIPKGLLGLIPGRVTYVIDKEGIVKFIFKSQFEAARHISESLEVIKKM